MPLQAQKTSIDVMTPQQVRQMMKAAEIKRGKGKPVAHIEDLIIPGPLEIPARIYIPEGNCPFPVLVFFHGGGFVLGDLDTHDTLCRELTDGGKCMVFSVDYRLAPEYKFPAGLQDCYAATQWVGKHVARWDGDPARIALGGDSAGGNLAAVIAQLVHRQGGPQVAFQLLIYPATDCRMSTPSVEENAEGRGLTKSDMIWYLDHYLNTDDEKLSPLVSPILAKDLRGLPPALIVTASGDPLRDAGELYGKRLAEAGVPVVISRYEGMYHDFLRVPPRKGKPPGRGVLPNENPGPGAPSAYGLLDHRFSGSYHRSQEDHYLQMLSLCYRRALVECCTALETAFTPGLVSDNTSNVHNDPLIDFLLAKARRACR
jgi:acetyl esterase